MHVPRLSLIAAVGAVATTTGDLKALQWTWSATGFGGGCSPAACTWQFNITAPAYLHFPGFTAECAGNTLQNDDNYVVCNQANANKVVVAAKLGNFGQAPRPEQITVPVSYAFTEVVLQGISVTYNFTGVGQAPYGRTVPPNQTFTVKPNMAYVTTTLA